MATRKTFHAVKVDAAPGFDLYRLQRPWAYYAVSRRGKCEVVEHGTLPAGTEVTPLSAGRDNTMDCDSRLVSVGGASYRGIW